MMNGQLLHFIYYFLIIAGSVHIETVPSGIEVIIDGDSYGESPIRVDSLPAGNHRLSLIPSPTRLWGIQPLDTLIMVDEFTHSFILRLPGTIQITSSPRGCLITEHDSPIGYTPLVLYRNPDKPITFTAEAPDHIPYRWTWNPLPGERTHMHVTPIRSRVTHSEIQSGHGNRILYLGAIALSMACGSIICSHEADRAYEKYGDTAHPSEISRLYDRAVLLDRCAGAFWIGFQVTIAGGIAWWLMG